MISPLKYTGERVVPDSFDVKDRILQEHVARYTYAATQIQARLKMSGPLIWDAPCGVGYGTRLLAEQIPGALLYGVDLDPETIEYANARYAHPHINFYSADLDTHGVGLLFDAIVCFEGIEHMKDLGHVAKILCQSLRQGGLVFVSTPRRNGPGAGSEFHTTELSRDELVSLFEPHLRCVEILGQDLKVGDCNPDEVARFYLLVGRR